MKYYKYIIILCCLSSILLAQQDFPISAYQCKDTTWFQGAGEDSLGLNLIHFGHHNEKKNALLDKLDAADNGNLQVIMGHATLDSSGRGDLMWYCQLHLGAWEAEDPSSFLPYAWHGNIVEDTFAHNDTAFVAFVDSLNPCDMLKTRADKVRFYGSSQILDIIFHLKIDSLSMDTLTPVCSLYVVKYAEPVHILLANKVLSVGEFLQPNQYQACSLSFDCPSSATTLYHGIYWFDNADLWCDFIEAKDRYVDSLVVHETYDGILEQIINIYNFEPALAFHYLLDEPASSYLSANAHVMDFLRVYSDKPGIQAVNYRGPDWYRTYVDAVDPYILSVDYYPLRGDWDSVPTPEDSGAIFQERLDTLCSVLKNARSVANQKVIDFWYVCQSFGQYTDIGTYHAREPTPRELKCMIWLGLAHGAKGIDHFLYRSYQEDTWYDSGLTRNDGYPRYPLWTAAKEMNFIIDSIGSTLLTLESDMVFKASEGVPPDCFIKKVWIWNIPDTLIQIGTFHDNTSDYFIIVNRHCLLEESLEVIVGLEDTLRFLYDCYSKETITYELLIGPPQPPYYYRVKLQPGQGRLFRVIPFEQEFAINLNQSYANMPYAALRTKATSSLGIDSMKIWQYYIPQQETLRHTYSTNWIPFDTTYFWYLRQEEGANTVYIQYKVDGSIKTPAYSDSIIFDKTSPTGSFVINDDSMFTNNSNVTLKNSFTDSLSDMSRMRYGNKFLKNLVKNSGFDSTDNWEYDTAIYYSDLDLFEIPVQTIGNYFYQSIAPESLSEFNNDTMLLWIDLVSDTFVGTGRIEFQYIYEDTAVRHEHPIGCSISIPQGTNAKVSHYNLYSYFMFQPDSDSVFTEVRVGVFVDTHSVVDNKGRLFIDNLRLDVVGPPNDYTRFENYDSLKEWTLTSGNGVRKVYGQFSDGAGNETGVLFDSIIVDTTRPAAHISSPQDDQIISGTVKIAGWACDYDDPEQHFKEYELKYQKFETERWYGIDPDSLSYTPVDSSSPPKSLGEWNTREVTNNHGDGSYYLKLTVRDSAGNYQGDTTVVYIRNDRGADGEFLGFSNHVYGLAAQDEIYIGEIGTGKIYRYNTNYQMIDTFNLIDSVGIGFPLAMAIDDSGKLWASNITSHLINRFTPQGNLLLQFGSNFSLPSGIGFDNSGNIWVSDRMHHKIKKFNQSGDTLFQFGTRGSEYGEIKRPTGIALYDDKIYIAESRNRRISVFDTLGDFIRVIGESAGLLMPFGLVIDSTGCIFVSDFIGDRVIEFGPSGNQLLEIDSILDAPSGLALSPDANILYVSDTKHKRVLAFTVRSEPQGGGGPQSHSDVYINRLMFDVYPSIFSEQLNIRLQGLGQGAGDKVLLNIYDVTGRLVKSFSRLTPDALRPMLITWYGNDNQGRQVSCGVYFIRLAVGSVGETPDYIETKKAILLK